MGNLVSIPWDGTTVGDAGPYSASEWQTRDVRLFGRSGFTTGSVSDPNQGIIPTHMEAFRPSATGAANSISILRGSALVNGVLVAFDSAPAITATFDSNVSGNPRIDRVVLEVSYVTQEANVFVVKGTPAASPSPPALTQSGVKWQIPVCQVLLANGYASIPQSVVTDEREFVNVPPVVQFYLQNRDGATVASGAGVTAASNAEAFTTASRDADHLYGVLQGYVANLGYGHAVAGKTRILTDGLQTFGIGDFATIGTTPGTWVKYNPNTDYARAPVSPAHTLEVSVNQRYVNAMVMSRCVNFMRFQYYANTAPTQYSGANASPTFARVGATTNWECQLNSRANNCPVFVNAWFVCRNDTGGFGTIFRLYNSTQAAYVSTAFDQALVGTTWYLINIWGIDFAPAAGLNTYHLYAATGGGGNWVTRGGSMWAWEMDA